jgi:hypothetical protein
MTLSVFIQTLKDKARGNLLAILLILVFVTYMVIMFPEVQKMTDIDEIMKSPAFQAMLGKAPDFTSFDGFMSIEAFALIGLIICGYIGFLTASFLAGEIEMKTIDLLLAQPVTRIRLVIDRYGALLPMVALLVLALLTGVFLGTKIMNIDVSYQGSPMRWPSWACSCWRSGDLPRLGSAERRPDLGDHIHGAADRHVLHGDDRAVRGEAERGSQPLAVPLRAVQQYTGLPRPEHRQSRRPYHGGYRFPGAGHVRFQAQGHQRDVRREEHVLKNLQTNPAGPVEEHHPADRTVLRVHGLLHVDIPVDGEPVRSQY